MFFKSLTIFVVSSLSVAVLAQAPQSTTMSSLIQEFIPTIAGRVLINPIPPRILERQLVTWDEFQTYVADNVGILQDPTTKEADLRRFFRVMDNYTNKLPILGLNDNVDMKYTSIEVPLERLTTYKFVQLLFGDRKVDSVKVSEKNIIVLFADTTVEIFSAQQAVELFSQLQIGNPLREKVIKHVAEILIKPKLRSATDYRHFIDIKLSEENKIQIETRFSVFHKLDWELLRLNHKKLHRLYSNYKAENYRIDDPSRIDADRRKDLYNDLPEQVIELAKSVHQVISDWVKFQIQEGHFQSMPEVGKIILEKSLLTEYLDADLQVLFPEGHKYLSQVEDAVFQKKGIVQKGLDAQLYEIVEIVTQKNTDYKASYKDKHSIFDPVDHKNNKSELEFRIIPK